MILGSSNSSADGVALMLQILFVLSKDLKLFDANLSLLLDMEFLLVLPNCMLLFKATTGTDKA